MVCTYYVKLSHKILKMIGKYQCAYRYACLVLLRNLISRLFTFQVGKRVRQLSSSLLAPPI